MRYSFVSAAILAFVSSAFAGNPTDGFDVMSVPSITVDTVTAGSSYTIKWASTSQYPGTITLSLMQGASTGTLVVASNIQAGVTNSLNSYTWNIPSNIEIFAFYGIQISYDNDPTIFQWSFPFHITAAGAATGGAVSTKTIQLSTGTAYAASSSSSQISTSTSANSTTLTSSSTSSRITASSNATLSTSATLTAATTDAITTTKTTKSSTGAASATSSGAATKSSSAAVANIAKGSFAIVGAFLAFAL